MAKIAVIYLDIKTGVYKGVHHGLAALGAYMKERGHEFRVFHALDENEAKDFQSELATFAPDIIGVSATSNQYPLAEKFLANALPAGNTAQLLIGGNHATLVPHDVMAESRFDFLCIGEGELPLSQLAERLDTGGDTTDIPGIWARGKDGTIYENPPPPLIEDIDTLPFPDFDLFDFSSMLKEESGKAYFILSRGCPFNCFFCCNHAFRALYPNKGKYFRCMSVDRGIQLMKTTIEKYPDIKEIFFEDDILGMNKDWTNEFCTRYMQEVGLPFACNLRIEVISEEVVRALAEAGCHTVNIGIESGNEWIRRNMLNKKFSNDDVKKSVALMHRFGIKVFAYNIIGLPFETEERIQDTINLNIDSGVDAGVVFFFYPYPGTRLYEICKENALMNEEVLRSSYTEGPSIKVGDVPRARLMRLYYSFRWKMYRRRLMTSVSLPPVVKMPVIFAMDVMVTIFPGMIKKLIQDGGLKSAIRKIISRR